eukprot:NODE_1174_length_1904_cov_0.962881.p4 type:complete len:115 gc:universal NODE_1174_length_1904_cov_0.962881:1330-986(-)
MMSMRKTLQNIWQLLKMRSLLTKKQLQKITRSFLKRFKKQLEKRMSPMKIFKITWTNSQKVLVWTKLKMLLKNSSNLAKESNLNKLHQRKKQRKKKRQRRRSNQRKKSIKKAKL